MSGKNNDKLAIHKENIISHKTTNISKEYTFGKIVGEGAFGKVRLGVHKATKQTRAIKILQKSKIDMKDLLNEIEILSKLSHPNIMQIYEIFDDNTNIYIVSEYCKGGELFDIIDLKPENILMDDDKGSLNIKIIDWGCAQTIKSVQKTSNADGTSYYIAPEVLRGEYNEKCDIWACGVILYILLCGYAPFDGETDEEIHSKVLEGKFEFPEEDWKNVTDEAKNLIKKMLTMDIDKRISALETMKDLWFQKFEKKTHYDRKLAKNVLSNMKKFKKNKTLEKTIISFIINQLVKKDERNELEKQFKEWDTNGDGVLSREEIINGYKKAYGKVDENEIDNMIKSIDLDGNGVIDYNEFLVCSMNKEKILRNDNLRICFNEFDTDHSGKISIDEISVLFNKGDKNNENLEELKKMMKEADGNGDGEISFDEFKEIMNKFFN